MRILFLDDNHDRHDVFRMQAIGHHVDHVYTARQALDMLKENTYDRVYLDHDLGGPESENLLLNNEEDGRYVAREIAIEGNLNQPCNTLFIVHSLNVIGAREMAITLAEYGLDVILHPFAWKKPVQ